MIALATVSAAEVPESRLPEPLTLTHALSLADEIHPDLERANAILERAEADQQAAASVSRPRLLFEGALSAVEPSSRAKRFGNTTHNASFAKLRLTKRIYDFGRSASTVDAAAAEVNGREWEFIDTRQQRRLDIMAAYFNVLLADLEYARDSEATAIAFVRMDRARSRNELGELSDVELRRLESRYQQSRHRRQLSETSQHAVRSRLAIALNRPGQLSSRLEMPAIAAIKREPEDLEVLSKIALENNPRLQALRARITAAEDQVQATRAKGKPVLRGELQAAANLVAARHKRDEANRELARTLELYERTLLSDHDRNLAEIAAAEAEAAFREADAVAIQTKLKLEYSQVRAPFDGVVIAVPGEIGEAVVSGLQVRTLVVVAENRRMRAKTNISANRIVSIQSGSPARVGVSGAWFDAEVQHLGLEAMEHSPEGVVYELWVIFDKPDDSVLRAGQQAKVRLDE